MHVCVLEQSAIIVLQDHRGDSFKAHPSYLNYYDVLLETSSRLFPERGLIVVSSAPLISMVNLHGEGACFPAVSLSRCRFPLLRCEMNTVNCHNEKLTFTLIKTESSQHAKTLRG